MSGCRVTAIALGLLTISDMPAVAQSVQLPTISVTASPVQHRAVRSAAAPGPRHSGPDQPAAAPTPEPQWQIGVLPVATDTFAPLTVIPGFEIDSSAAASLG